jgi:hypothetical protein
MSNAPATAAASDIPADVTEAVSEGIRVLGLTAVCRIFDLEPGTVLRVAAAGTIVRKSSLFVVRTRMPQLTEAVAAAKAAAR